MTLGIFNAVRPTIERYEEEEEPGVKLARKFAASPSSLSRAPIVELARAVSAGKAKSRYLIVPQHRSTAWHPFVATFHDEFASKGAGQPLELFAMADVLAEAHLHAIGVRQEQIDGFLSLRDQLLRNLANESGRQSALSVANNLLNARNNPDGLEEKVCAAFRSLGFEVTPLRKRGEPDGVATANLSASGDGNLRRYSVSLEAKSKEKDGTKVSAKSVGISTVARQRDKFECDHAVVVGPAFPTSQGDRSALAEVACLPRASLRTRTGTQGSRPSGNDLHRRGLG